ncbi:plasmid replication protein, CyRepA1 family [Pokkaliibacter sp. CJK22405]|uniref:plasmid replication protein, CyRepA1 family n=1 Tax=Pokkaliibacter sp. CJK22405 TaxID=3384615 RepID=UPI00398554A5
MTTERSAHSSLAAYYQARFNSDPVSLAEYCSAQIADAVAQSGIDFDATGFGGLDWLSGKDSGLHPKHTKYLEKADQGRAKLYTGLRHKDGIVYPIVSANSQRASRMPSHWDGLSALWELFKADKGIKDSAAEARRKALQEERRKKREAEAEARRKQRELEEQCLQSEHAAYQACWEQQADAEYLRFDKRKKQAVKATVEWLGIEDGSAPYLQRKQISSIAQRVEMARMRDSMGEFSALRLQNIHGEYCGLQRLYENQKRQTVSVRSGQFKGAHIVIGDIKRTRTIGTAEGFATAASINLATNAVMVVCISASNLMPVIAEYKQRTNLTIRNFADNDQWKPKAGNTGALVAVELREKLGIKSLMPSFSAFTQQQAFAKTDWNDLHVLGGIRLVSEQIRSKGAWAWLPAKKLDLALYSLQFAADGSHDRNPANITDLIKKTVNIGMSQIPVNMSGKQLCERIRAHCPAHLADRVNWQEIHQRLKWLAAKKFSQARAVGGFTREKIEQAHIRHIRLPVDYQTMPDGSRRMAIPQRVLDFIQMTGDGVFIVRAPMGSGKTEKIISPLMTQSRKAAYIAHRISLVGDAASRLSQSGQRVRNYSDLSWFEMFDTTHMACCVNSMIKPAFFNNEGTSWFETLDHLSIDEATQVVRHIVDGSACDSPVRVFDALVNAMRHTRQVVLADAGANDQLISFAELARPGEPIYVIEVEGQPDDIRVLHGERYQVYKQAADIFAAGGKPLICADSAEEVKGLVETLRTIDPTRKVLGVLSDSKADEDVQRFQQNPNAECVNWDCIIYSPSISSGVSITTPHFTHHVGIFTGTVSPADVTQMLRRDRTAKTYLIGLNIQSRHRPTDRDAIWRGRLTADAMTWAMEEEVGQVAFIRQKTLFDEVAIDFMASDNKSRNDYANSLLLMMMAEGWKVDALAADEIEAEIGREQSKTGREAAFAKWVALVTSEETPEEEAAQRLQRAEVRSQAEQAQLARYAIETTLCDTVNPDSIEFLDDNGVRYINRLELLQATETQAKAYDDAQRRGKVVGIRHRHKVVMQRWYRMLFATLGIDPFTGEGEFGIDECKALLQQITADQQALEAYNAIDAGPMIDSKSLPRDPVAFAKNWLARFGLTTLKRKTRGRNLHHINPLAWQKVVHYVGLRAAAGVHSLGLVDISSESYDPMTLPTQNTLQATQHADSDGRDTLPCNVYNLAKHPQITVAVEQKIRDALPSQIAVTLREALEWVGHSEELYQQVLSGELDTLQLQAYFEALAAQRDAHRTHLQAV